ncbi:6-bladed beta-propeller [Sunxiuqinia rutila]|uniref:6-bladed beta-propeller n=1 Tax=Sunxiuqinia rutila TaxID=1397841 RepID=UPI003D35B9A0
MRRTITFILISLLAISCHHEKQDQQEPELHHINLLGDSISNSPIKLSSIATKLRYVTLESNSETRIAPGNRISVLDSFIINTGFQKISLFCAKTGQFIREIGEHGRGPNGYLATSYCVYKDPQRGIIINARGSKYSLLEYNVSGQLIGKLETFPWTSYVTRLNQENYAAFFVNDRGNDSRMRIYNQQDGKIVSEFPNYKQTIEANVVRKLGLEGWFYYKGDSLLFKEYLNDTIFQVTEQKLIPKFVFNSGEFSPPYEERETFNPVDYHRIDLIMESKRYLFFRFIFKKKTHFSLYDKITRTSRISSLDKQQTSGYQNDLDNFVMFCPQALSNNNELVGFIEPYQLLEWFKKNPEQIPMLPPHLQKLKNIKKYDNPVVVIATLKE